MKIEKRLLDLILCVPSLIIILPLMLLLALLIRLDSPGPVFFKQTRIGYKGKPFTILKFRTMVVDAEKLGPPLTIGGDPRITRIGRFLRKYKLDELPQIFNVIRGEMTLVGPRPEVEKYVGLYNERQRQVLNLVPGITDPASILYRNENEMLAAAVAADASGRDIENIYIEEIIPAKVELNLRYAKRATIFSDFRVIIATLVSLTPLGSRTPSKR